MGALYPNRYRAQAPLSTADRRPSSCCAAAEGEALHPGRGFCLAAGMQPGERFPHLVEEAGREEAEGIGVGLRHLAQIIAGLNEFVAFIDHDP